MSLNDGCYASKTTVVLIHVFLVRLMILLIIYLSLNLTFLHFTANSIILCNCGVSSL